MLEQYLKLDQISESINYHCIMLWSSLFGIIWADKFVASKKFSFWENFKNLNLPVFIKEGMVSIMIYLFEKYAWMEYFS